MPKGRAHEEFGVLITSYSAQLLRYLMIYVRFYAHVNKPQTVLSSHSGCNSCYLATTRSSFQVCLLFMP